MHAIIILVSYSLTKDFSNTFELYMNLGKMYSWKFDIQPFKEESFSCSLRGRKFQIYASTKNKLFILGGIEGGFGSKLKRIYQK